MRHFCLTIVRCTLVGMLLCLCIMLCVCSVLRVVTLESRGNLLETRKGLGGRLVFLCLFVLRGRMDSTVMSLHVIHDRRLHSVSIAHSNSRLSTLRVAELLRLIALVRVTSVFGGSMFLNLRRLGRVAMLLRQVWMGCGDMLLVGGPAKCFRSVLRRPHGDD